MGIRQTEGSTISTDATGFVHGMKSQREWLDTGRSASYIASHTSCITVPPAKNFAIIVSPLSQRGLRLQHH